MALRRMLQPLIRSQVQLIDQQLPQTGRWYTSKADEQKQQQQHPLQEEQQQQPATTTVADTKTTAAATRPAVEEEWTEVIDEKTGQPYYWNPKTGETTDLGEPRPKTRFKDQEWEQAANSGPFQEGWREPPGRDHTYFYSVIGVGIGVAAGWFTQYLH